MVSILGKENSMSIYRRIYEQHRGPIPVDEKGRSYDIHHIDGDHANDDISNLTALSLQEHYNVHWRQGDYGACKAIAMRMESELTREERSALSRMSNRQRVENGTHNWLDAEANRRRALQLVADGTHHWLSEKHREDTSIRVLERVENGTHNWCDGRQPKQLAQRLLAEGRHHSQVLYECPCCGRSGYGNSFKGKHFKKCKSSKSVIEVIHT